MARLNKYTVAAALSANITEIGQKRRLCDRQAASVSSAAAGDARLEGAAYKKCFTYLSEVKLPHSTATWSSWTPLVRT